MARSCVPPAHVSRSRDRLRLMCVSTCLQAGLVAAAWSQLMPLFTALSVRIAFVHTLPEVTGSYLVMRPVVVAGPLPCYRSAVAQDTGDV